MLLRKSPASVVGSPLAILILSLAAILVFAACAEEETAPLDPDQVTTDPTGDDLVPPGQSRVPAEPTACVSTRDFFAKKVWSPVMQGRCDGCHSATGLAKETKMVLQPPTLEGFLDHNYEVVREIAAFEYNGTSIILLKPTAQISHGGGKLLDVESEDYAALESLVAQLKNPVECEDDPLVLSEFYEGVTLLDPIDTWRKAAVIVASRLPTEQEEAFLAIEGELGLDVLLDELLMEQAFVDWVKEVYNDQLLTDRYLLAGQDGEQRALNLLSTDDFPNLFWFNAPTPDTDMSLLAQAPQQTNRAVAREALELIAYVVRNDRPFSEILTADYMVVNPWSANTYGVTSQITFDDPYDPNEFREARIEGYPHAGVLTSSMYLNRFPTSATNVNRHRSRMVYRFFLATDVLKLAERPVDPTEIESHNPTMFNPSCSVCHSNIDPVAGCFQNWSEVGRYMPPEQGWHPDMLPPGFAEAEVPNNEHTRSLQWLAKEITKDPRFAKAAIYIMYHGLTGQTPITLPMLEDESGPTTPTYDNRMIAHDAQQAFFEQVIQKYDDGDQQLRVVVKALILSPWFRAENYEGELTPEREIQLERLGTARFLTPELLDRKVEAITGLPWRDSPNSARKLLSSNDYLIFYGGINSDDVTRRITDPNGLMGSVAQRLANEMSCMGITGDLVRSPQQRRLLPYVSASYAPEDANGFVVQVAVEAIRENIRYLHWKITGERLSPDSDVIDDTYELFYDVWYEGREAVWNGDEPSSLPGPCQITTDLITGQPLPAAKHITHDPDYTIRAWMAVTTYLMSDYRFLYE